MTDAKGPRCWCLHRAGSRFREESSGPLHGRFIVERAGYPCIQVLCHSRRVFMKAAKAVPIPRHQAPSDYERFLDNYYNLGTPSRVFE